MSTKPKAIKLNNAIRKAIMDKAWGVIDNPELAAAEAKAVKLAARDIEKFARTIMPVHDRAVLKRHGVHLATTTEVRIHRHAEVQDGDSTLRCFPVTAFSKPALSLGRQTSSWDSGFLRGSPSADNFHWPDGYAYRLLHLKTKRPFWFVDRNYNNSPRLELEDANRVIENDAGGVTGLPSWYYQTVGRDRLFVNDTIHAALSTLSLATARYMANRIALTSIVARITNTARTFEQVEELWPELSKYRSEVLAAGGVGDAVQLPAIHYGVSDQEIEALRHNSEQRLAA